MRGVCRRGLSDRAVGESAFAKGVGGVWGAVLVSRGCQFVVHLKSPGFCLLSPDVLSGGVYLLCGNLLAFLSAQLEVLCVIHLLHPVNPGREFSRTETCLYGC